LIRRGMGERFGGEWKKEMEEVGSWRLGWAGRVVRGALKDRLEEEVWDVEVERGNKMRWTVVIEKGKKEVKEEWERNRKEWMLEGIVGVSDANIIEGRVGVEGVIWVYGNRYKSWRKGKGYGLTVGDGEMEGVGNILDEVRRYEGNARKLIVGVDNVGVLKS